MRLVASGVSRYYIVASAWCSLRAEQRSEYPLSILCAYAQMSPRCNTSPATDVLCARFSLSHPSSWLNFGVSYKVGDCNIWNGTAWIVVILCMLCVQTNECVPLNSPMFHGLPAEQPRPPTPQGQRTLFEVVQIGTVGKKLIRVFYLIMSLLTKGW